MFRLIATQMITRFFNRLPAGFGIVKMIRAQNEALSMKRFKHWLEDWMSN
ncbi:MAG TPA: hypothetical protein VF478_11715 [Anaerolineae bacterium]